MDRGRQNRRGGFTSSYQRYSSNTHNRSGLKKCTLCKQDGHLRFECMKEFKFEDEEGNEWVKWTLTRKEYELVKREREKERVKKEMLMKKEKLKDEMRMKKEIELEIAREKRERCKSKKRIESESDEDSEDMSEEVERRGKERSMTKSKGEVNKNKNDEDKMMRMLENLMTRQEEMMRELEEVRGSRHENEEKSKSKDNRKSMRKTTVKGMTEENENVVTRSVGTGAKGKQKGVLVKATYVPRAALDEEEYDDNEEVVGEVPIATEELCNALNRAWLARENMRKNKVMGPVKIANVKRMVSKHAENIDESVGIQAMINVVCAYGGEVLDDMGFEELVHELGVIYK